MESLSYTDICLFWMHVKKSGHCWEWQGSLTKSGYGRLYLNGKVVRAHRISYLLHNGTISGKNIICHTCDNPKCVNPEHLWHGDNKSNTKDMMNKGRHNWKKSKSKGKSSKYLGVSYRKEYGKWRARKMVNYKNILLGHFDSEQEAAESIKKFHPPQ